MPMGVSSMTKIEQLLARYREAIEKDYRGVAANVHAEIVEYVAGLEFDLSVRQQNLANANAQLFHEKRRK